MPWPLPGPSSLMVPMPLPRLWLQMYQGDIRRQILQHERQYQVAAERLAELRLQEDLCILKEAQVVGMTTTGEWNVGNVLALPPGPPARTWSLKGLMPSTEAAHVEQRTRPGCSLLSSQQRGTLTMPGSRKILSCPQRASQQFPASCLGLTTAYACDIHCRQPTNKRQRQPCALALCSVS